MEGADFSDLTVNMLMENENKKHVQNLKAPPLREGPNETSVTARVNLFHYHTHMNNVNLMG